MAAKVLEQEVFGPARSLLRQAKGVGLGFRV